MALRSPRKSPGTHGFAALQRRTLSAAELQQFHTFYLERDCSHREIASLIGGVSGETVRREMAGTRLDARTVHKIERFLKGCGVAA